MRHARAVGFRESLAALGRLGRVLRDSEARMPVEALLGGSERRGAERTLRHGKVTAPEATEASHMGGCRSANSHDDDTLRSVAMRGRMGSTSGEPWAAYGPAALWLWVGG
jgi:hypothetical protein